MLTFITSSAILANKKQDFYASLCFATEGVLGIQWKTLGDIAPQECFNAWEQQLFRLKQYSILVDKPAYNLVPNAKDACFTVAKKVFDPTTDVTLNYNRVRPVQFYVLNACIKHKQNHLEKQKASFVEVFEKYKENLKSSLNNKFTALINEIESCINKLENFKKNLSNNNNLENENWFGDRVPENYGHLLFYFKIENKIFSLKSLYEDKASLENFGFSTTKISQYIKDLIEDKFKLSKSEIKKAKERGDEAFAKLIEERNEKIAKLNLTGKTTRADYLGYFCKSLLLSTFVCTFFAISTFKKNAFLDFVDDVRAWIISKRNPTPSKVASSKEGSANANSSNDSLDDLLALAK